MFLPLHDANPLKRIYFQFFTVAVILVCIGVHMYSQTLQPAALQGFLENYGMVPAQLSGHTANNDALSESWTPLTSVFLHADFWHLLGNMMFLWVFGDNVEDEIGHPRFILFFIICAFVAGCLQAGIESTGNYIVVGASGAVSGILGGYLLLHPKQNVFVLIFSRIPVILPSFIVISAWAAFQLYQAIATPVGSAVAWWAHVGGFVAGVLLMAILRPRRA